MEYKLTSIDNSSLVDRYYVNGGYVRDLIRGEASNDIDYCVEATEEEFEKEFPHFKKILVDNKFPVYYDEFGNEHALTRQEEFQGSGDKNCVVTGVGVTIEKDLHRRDFSVGSLAIKYSTGEIIDVVNGVEDIKNKVLRTINKNFIIDDPNRGYRLARFAATLEFSIDPETAEIVKKDREYLKTVTPERVLKELQKAYKGSKKPSVFFRTLKDLEVLDIHFKELADSVTVITGREQHHPEIWNFEHLMNSFDYAKSQGYDFSTAVSALVHDFGKNLTPKEEYPRHIGHEHKLEILDQFFDRHRFDAATQKLSRVVFKNHMKIHILPEMRDIKKIQFVRRIPRNLRQDFINACNCDSPLSQERLDLFDKTCKAIDTAIIDVPKHILKSGKEAVDNFVNNTILKRFKEL